MCFSQATLQRLAAILESVEKLERLLKIGRTPTDGEASEIDQLAERQATELSGLPVP